MVLFTACTLSLQAEVILDLTFDDPQGLIKSKPAGIEKVTGEFNASTVTIASGTGGRALPQISDGPPNERQDKPADARIQVLSEPAMGTPAFLRLAADEEAITRVVSTGILPKTAENALSSLVTYQDGRAAINGGLDFFFRSAADNGYPPKIVFSSRCGPLGFNIGTDPNGSTVLAKIFTSKRDIDIDGDKTGDKVSIENRSAADLVLEAGKIYHAALVFRTAPDGAITMDFCLQPGAGPLKPVESVVVSVNNFWLPGENRPQTADKMVLGIGRSQFAQTLDLARIRIFNPAPDVFPGLGGAK